MSHQDADRLSVWNAMARPPKHALKQIKGGRLQGMTDVNPQWRYQTMTEQFGPCGVGWKWSLEKTWTEPGTDGQVMVFALVHVCVRAEQLHFEWSDPVMGVGGSLLIAKEKDGLRTNDEAYKMAVTDALSVALKMLGVAADVYAGRWDGTKWDSGETAKPSPAKADVTSTVTAQSPMAPATSTPTGTPGKPSTLTLRLKAVKPGRSGSKGEIVSEHGESFLCYDQRSVGLAEQCFREGVAVVVEIAFSTSGNRYAKGVTRAAVQPAPSVLTTELDAASIPF